MSPFWTSAAAIPQGSGADSSRLSWLDPAVTTTVQLRMRYGTARAASVPLSSPPEPNPYVLLV
jgi:hypothetical protein